MTSIRNYGGLKNILEIDLGADTSIAADEWLVVEAFGLDPIGLYTDTLVDKTFQSGLGAN